MTINENRLQDILMSHTCDVQLSIGDVADAMMAAPAIGNTNIFSDSDGNNYDDYYDDDENVEYDDDGGKIYKSETVALVLIPKSPVHRCPLIFCRRPQRPTCNKQ